MGEREGGTKEGREEKEGKEKKFKQEIVYTMRVYKSFNR